VLAPLFVSDGLPFILHMDVGVKAGNAMWSENSDEILVCSYDLGKAEPTQVLLSFLSCKLSWHKWSCNIDRHIYVVAPLPRRMSSRTILADIIPGRNEGDVLILASEQARQTRDISHKHSLGAVRW
jgi:hypothetical protein